MLKILLIVPLLIVLLLSGLACHRLPPGNSDVRSSPSPSPLGSIDSSRPDAVKQQPRVQVRLNGLTLGMSLDSVTAIMNAKGYRASKKPGTLRYDFSPKEPDQHHMSGSSIVVDENDQVVEINAEDYDYPPAIELIGINGTSGELKLGDRTKKIISMLGEPQQKINIGDKKEDWVFPRLGLVLTVLGPDHYLSEAHLKKSDKK
ncbi:MAG: hypothetical protein AB9903_25465 [Vulcanimicrobiota bacterium]